MKVYVDENRGVYTEKTINDRIRETLKSSDYEDMMDYIFSKYTDSELFAILPPNVQKDAFENWKARILKNNFYEREINESDCPFGKCPYIK